MRALTVILALRVPIQLVMFLFKPSIILVSLTYLFAIVEFLFLIQIYKGYEFEKLKEEEVAEEVQE